jgi:hypothetical protein
VIFPSLKTPPTQISLRKPLHAQPHPNQTPLTHNKQIPKHQILKNIAAKTKPKTKNPKKQRTTTKKNQKQPNPPQKKQKNLRSITLKKTLS